MTQTGNPEKYHAIIESLHAGGCSYTIYAPDGNPLIVGWHEGPEEQVADYLERTTLKRYNANPDAMARDYFNTETKLEDDITEAQNALAT